MKFFPFVHNSIDLKTACARKQTLLSAVCWAWFLLGFVEAAGGFAASAQQQQDKSMGNMPGMNIGEMSDMGPSMAAIAGHTYVTPVRPKQPGDEEKVKAVVAQVKATIERYKDYRKALADGYVIGNRQDDEPQFHFTKEGNGLEDEHRFDPAKPDS